VAQE
jgi:hypothetical protein